MENIHLRKTKRFVSVRLTEEEFNEVYKQCRRSTCRSLTEYVKKVLTKKPVTIKVRNQSQDCLLQAMIGIKNRLDQLADRIEPAGSSAHTQPQQTGHATLLREIAGIRSLTRQIFEKWSQ